MAAIVVRRERSHLLGCDVLCVNGDCIETPLLGSKGTT